VLDNLDFALPMSFKQYPNIGIVFKHCVLFIYLQLGVNEESEEYKTSLEKFKMEFRHMDMLIKKENTSDKDGEVVKTWYLIKILCMHSSLYNNLYI